MVNKGAMWLEDLTPSFPSPQHRALEREIEKLSGRAGRVPGLDGSLGPPQTHHPRLMRPALLGLRRHKGKTGGILAAAKALAVSRKMQWMLVCAIQRGHAGLGAERNPAQAEGGDLP